MKFLKPALILAAVLLFAGEVWFLKHGKMASPKPEPSTEFALPPKHALTAHSVKPVDIETLAIHASRASKTIQTIVDDGRNYNERLDAVRTIVTNLPEADWLALRDYLLRKDTSDATQSGLAFKNELLNQLGSLRPLPAEFGDTLIEMTRSGSLDSVMRDYALQDLAAYYDELDASHRLDPQMQQAIQNTLWDGLSETDSSIAGTALLALERLSQNHEGFDQSKIAWAALQLADDNRSGELTRITAFQVCAGLGVGDALSAAIQTAEHGETVPLQISAISALGVLGGDDQVPFLKSFINGAEDRLQLPAKRALHQIMARSANRK